MCFSDVACIGHIHWMRWVFLLQTVVHIPNVLPQPNEDCYIFFFICCKDVLEMLEYFSQLLEMMIFFFATYT
jgi:hypothetical protein